MTDAAGGTGGQPTSTRRRLPASPCVGICTINDTTQWCVGCGRTSDDVTDWSSLDDNAKRDIWRQLPGRLAAMSVGIFRLAPEPEEIADFVVRSLREDAGRWAVGAANCALAFEPSGHLTFSECEREVTAMDEAGNAIRLQRHERVRAFGLALEAGQARMQAVALVLPRGRAQMGGADDGEVRRVDINAIRPEDRTAALFDLKVDGSAMQAMLRSPHDGFGFDIARGMANRQISLHDDAAIDSLCDSGATIVLETAMGRVEARQSQLIDVIAKGQADIPEAFAACAVFTAHDPDWLAAAFDLR